VTCNQRVEQFRIFFINLRLFGCYAYLEKIKYMMNMNIGLEDIALMPHDNWDDHRQWDIFFKKIRPKVQIPFNSMQDMSLRFCDFARTSALSIWFPGCGLDYAPIIYSTLSFKVYATDISDTAISFQEELNNKPPQKIFKDWEGFKNKFQFLKIDMNLPF
jgi:hypothetical protein